MSSDRDEVTPGTSWILRRMTWESAVLSGALTVTSRRKERGIVDGVVLFGAVFDLMLLLVAVASLRSRRERVGWMHYGIVVIGVVAVIVGNVLLLRWVASP